ncbi:MAG: M28 family peptidase, partial [Actinobacteria bacterium]
QYRGSHSVELVPLNGEDYYAAPGQVVWMAENADRLDDIVLGMNTDDAGCVEHSTSVSFYGLPDEVEAAVRSVLEERPGFAEGPQWPQGDHSLFTMNGVPAIAFTSENFMEVLATTTHTERDTPDLVDPEIVADVARFMADVIGRLG